MNSSQPPSSFVVPILGSQRAPSAAGTIVQHNQPSVTHSGDGNIQHVQDTAAYVEPSTNQDCQNQATTADVCSGECDQTGLPHSGGSSGHPQRVPCPSSAERIDGDSEYDGGDEDEGSDGGEEDKLNDVDNNCPKADGIEKLNAKMSSQKADSKMGFLTPKVRRGAVNYPKEDRIDLKMLAGRLSAAEVTLTTASYQARRESGVKKASWEIVEDDEVKVTEARRVKRMKRGGNSAGSTRQPLAECQGNLQPSSKGEYKRQGSLAKTSRRPDTRPVGSAVIKLHKDRLRRRATKSTQNKSPGFGYYPQPDITVYANYYSALNAAGEPKPRPSSHRQRQAGSERINPTLNPTVEDTAGDTLGHASSGAPEGNGSNNPGDHPNSREMTRNNARTEPRRQHQQPAVNTVRDDPFFSDELFNGMLNDQPDSNHVGSMYTRSHQREIDAYYQRVTDPRPRLEPESDTLENPITSSAQQQTTHNIPGAAANGGNAAPVTQAPNGALRLARSSINDLDYGNITDWNSAWSSFVNDHDSKHLMRGHYPDEYN